MSYFSAILLLARTDLKRVLKDRSTVLWLFIMPAFFFYFIGTVTQGGLSFTDDTVKLVVENNDGGFLALHLEARLEENLFSIIRPQDVPPPEEGEESTKYRKLVIPSGFTAQLKADQQVGISFEGLRSGYGNQYDFFRVQKAAFSVLGDLIVVKSGGTVVSPETLALATEGDRPVQLLVTPAGRQLQIPSGFQQAIPGTLVMFTLLVLLTSGAANGGGNSTGLGGAVYLTGSVTGQPRKYGQPGGEPRCFCHHDTGGPGWLLVADRSGACMGCNNYRCSRQPAGPWMRCTS